MADLTSQLELFINNVESEVANAIIDLLENSKKCDNLGSSGFKLIHEICNSDTMSLNYLKIYQKFLKDHI